MQLSKNTSTSRTKSLLIKVILILIIVIGAIAVLDKIKFPSPSKTIEKFISNEKLKIVR